MHELFRRASTLRAASRRYSPQKPFNFEKYAQFHSSWRRYSEELAFKAKRTATLTPTMVLLGIMPILTFALGTWQVQRLKWKVNLIDELQEKLHRKASILPSSVDDSEIQDLIYRKFVIEGHWDNAHTVLVGPKVRDGTQGHHVVTPLVREDGSIVLVDRGFVSNDFANLQDWRIRKEDENAVKVLGMVRTTPPRNYFTPDNVPEKEQWYWIDVETLSRIVAGPEARMLGLYLEEIFEGHSGDAHLCVKQGTPIGRSPVVDLRNMHATYAVTWYSLSAFTAFMFIQLLRRRARAPAARMPR